MVGGGRLRRMASERDDDRGTMLRTFLAEHDEPCPACGYSLRGLTGETCPECGEALRLRVGMVEPRLGFFVSGLVGLASGAGFHGFVLIWAVWVLLFNGGGPEPRDIVLLLVGLLSCGVGLGVWLRARRRLRHASVEVRRLCLAACWAVPAMTVGSFVTTVG